MGGALVLAVGGYITHCQWAKSDRDKILVQIEQAATKRERELKAEVAEQKRINEEQSDEFTKDKGKLVAGYESYIKQLRDHNRSSFIADALPAGTGVDEGTVCFDRARLASEMAGFEARAEERVIRLLAEGDHARLVAKRSLEWIREQRAASEKARQNSDE